MNETAVKPNTKKRSRTDQNIVDVLSELRSYAKLLMMMAHHVTKVPKRMAYAKGMVGGGEVCSCQLHHEC
jgi:hypothetical protein